MSDKKKLLIFVDWFFPGFKAGGPIQSCKNLVTTFHNDFEFYIYTSDRDLGETAPYVNVVLNKWIPFIADAKVFYATPEFHTIKFINKTIDEIDPAFIYLNNMFSFPFTIKPLLVTMLRRKLKVILAPRGMLHDGALSIKPKKKLFYLNLLKLLGLNNRIIFHATDQQELLDIQRRLNPKIFPRIAQNIPNLNAGHFVSCKKESGTVKFVFVSRINKKKNILFFIDLLSHIKNCHIFLDIYGFVDDAEYFKSCKEAIDKLPGHITVTIKEAIPNSAVASTISKYHVFILPTLGENFGHSIFEALSVGRPVLISQHTPWKNLEDCKAGWDIPLENSGKYIEIIKEVSRWEQYEFDIWAESAFQYAADYVNINTIKESYTSLFS